jgi:hypothetical protein
MELPVVLVPPAPGVPVIAVDGAWGAPGLGLSHWPGNTTPADLRHDLSTGSALAFARLTDAERYARAAGAVAIANNHYDTDGTLALFAVRHPRAALQRQDALLEAAATGDFYELPSERGLVIDAIVSGLVDVERSPIASELRGRGDAERHALGTAHLLDALPAILDGDLAPYRELWEPVVERTRRELAQVERATREDAPAADLSVWTADAPWSATGPGRHALFGSTGRDRVLAIAPLADGHGYRLVVSTRSWFDLAGNAAQRAAGRPDVVALVATLNALEGAAESDDSAWRTQRPDGASPELWFGARELESFAEHSDALAPSRLSPERVRREVERVLAARA